MNEFLKKTTSTIPYLITLPLLVLIFYAVQHDFSLPYDGMDWSRISGQVQFVLPSSPSSSVIVPGDIILEIDDTPVIQLQQLYLGKLAGDQIKLSIQRDNEIFDVNIQLIEVPLQERILWLTPHFVAFIFLIIGSVIKAYSPNNLITNLFFLVCLFAGGVLTSGSISATGPAWASKLFNILLWWIGPATVHLHLHFPEDSPRKLTQVLHPVLYIIGIIGSVPYILLETSTILNSPWIQTFYTLGRLALASNLVIVVGLLTYYYFRPVRADTRHKVRFITFFGILSFLIIVSLSLLPGALLLRSLIPYEISLVPLILVPISYAYAIFRHRLLEIEKYVRRGAAYALVIIILLTLLLGILAILFNILHLSIADQPTAILLLILTFSAIFEPLRKQLQKLVDLIFYGGWYDYRSAIETLTDGLVQVNDPALLGNMITKRLVDILKLEYACLFLCDNGGSMLVYPASNSEYQEHDIEGLSLVRNLKIPLDGVLCQYLVQYHHNFNKSLMDDGLPIQDLSKFERLFYGFLKDKLIVPITGKQIILGILVLGPKIGGETYGSEDLNILVVISRQIGVLIQNAQLLDEIRKRASEVDKLHREIIRAREEEKKHLARELHDEIIQAMVGLNYHLSDLGVNGLETVKQEVRDIIQKLRRISSELRPLALDNLGLVSAIRSHIRRVSANSNLSIKIGLSLEGDEEKLLPEDVADNVYRVFAEALSNSLKHACASRIDVILSIHPREVFLEVKDDGIGFELPSRLGNLLASKHFGLVGIRERVEFVDGQTKIDSSPSEGTRIQVRIPIVVGED